MTDSKHESQILVVGPSRGPTMIDSKYTVIVTSGSTDYLRDKTGSQRFWPVRPDPSVIAPESRDESCDGLHDEGAPQQYLCSRCFTDGREDPSIQEDDEYEETCRDQDREMG